jgi:hypothetical protein
MSGPSQFAATTLIQEQRAEMILFRMAGRTREGRNSLSLFPRDSQWLVVLLGTALLVAAHAFAQTLPPEETPTSTIHGTVINSATQLPIPRALVVSPDNRYAALTDADGHFEFDVPKPRSEAATIDFYSGPVSMRRYGSRASYQISFTARKPGFLDAPDLQAAVGSQGDDITIPLMPEAVIKGRVSIAVGDPPLGILVQLFLRQVVDGLPRWLPGQSAQANSSGEFRFAELLPGTYKIATHEWMEDDPVAALPGSQRFAFPPIFYPGVPEFTSAATIELGAGQTFQADLSPVRQQYYDVKIPVGNGDVAPGFNISVHGPGGSQYELGYNQQEQRIEGMLPSGNFLVQATSYGPNAASGSVNLRVAGAPVEGPTLTLIPNNSIPLNVKEQFTDTQAPAPATWSVGERRITVHGPRLYLQANFESADDLEQRGGSVRPPTAPNDDTLVLDSVPPGKYWLRLSTSRGYIASATMGSTDLLRQPFTVGSGPSAPIEITLRDDVAEIDGTVTSLAEHNSSSGSSTAAGWVYCVPLADSGGQFQQMAVSEDGKFTNPMMPPGDYRVLAFSTPQYRLPYRDAEAMKPYETGGPVVHLTAGQKTTVQVPILSGTE